MNQMSGKLPKWVCGFLSLAFFTLIILAGIDIYQVAGHGAFLGHFDKIWGAIFIAYLILSIILIVVVFSALWIPEKIIGLLHPLAVIRKTWWLKWPLALLAVVCPTWILLYTSYGFDLSPFAIRFYLFVIASGLAASFLSEKSQSVLSRLGLIQGVLLFGSVFLIAKSLVTVTDFPLSLTWSEGNRIWDYSVLFGRDLYIYPLDKNIPAYIDRGRQSLWGLPFLLPEVTITQVRLWSAIVFTVPYVILGWILFRSTQIKPRAWVMAGLWVMLFLTQGPIYTPLVLAAILVALSRKWPLWLGLPLIFVAGYYAQISRLTWMFAPAIWATMMAINDHPVTLSRDKLKDWGIVAAYGFAGFMGGFGISGWRRLRSYFGKISENINPDNFSDSTSATNDIAEVVSQTAGSSTITDQPLLWSRLWPNPTYQEGILLGLTLAIAPLLILLIYFVISKRWMLNRWQKLGLTLPLLALLGVGIIISVKIGGGSNLHNLDMLLVALIFVAAFAWVSCGYHTIVKIEEESILLQIVVLLIVAIPSFYPVVNAFPLDLPPNDRINWTLEIIQAESDQAVAAGGDVLFMDQRQLLTFGNIKNVPLIADYEKKKVMDKAMSGDVEYFADFYRDLVEQRFALIIIEPQNIRYATADEDWSEENDVWVKWVTIPLFCYYEPKHEIKKTAVWIMTPRSEVGDCQYP